MSKSIPTTLLAVAALCLSTAAQAHGGTSPGDHHAISLLDGFVHPFTGLDHLAALLAVGMWSALATKRAWLAPLAFVNMLLAGALSGLSGFTLPALEPLVASSVLALGLLLAARTQLPGLAAAALVGGFAIFHGMAHGVEFATTGPMDALIGMVLGSTVLLTLGLLAGRALQQRSQWWPRLAGAAIALWGGVLLAQMA